jgi:hypothetical protein
MGVSYAAEAVGKQVSADLRRFACETGQTGIIHLPDFLDVEPAAPFETWKQGFVEQRKKANNADEGEAHAALLLCQNLTPHFANEDAWRRLLNRLGRDHIEADVASVARRMPSLDRIRRSYANHVETLAINVGVPDAAEVVEDVYGEWGLELAPDDVKCDDDLDSHDDFDVDDFEIGDVHLDVLEDDREVAAVGAGSGFLGRLGGALLEALGEHLDRKVDRTVGRIEEYPRVADEAPNVDGQWYSRNGGAFWFSQRGARIRLEGGAMGTPVSGQGRLVGRSVQLQGFSPAGGMFRCSLLVSDDGSSMTGQMIDSYGRSSPVELHR